jgi:hypothetical protein
MWTAGAAYRVGAADQAGSMKPPLDLDEPPVELSVRERDVRRRLMLSRDLASKGLCDLEPGHARTLYEILAFVSCASLYADAPIETLEDIVNFCRQLLGCARWLARHEF